MAEDSREPATNGAALAALLAAGVGAFALGLIVILNEAGALAVPAIYAPAGGVSGRTALAAAIWLIGWLILHRLWRGREIQTRRVRTVTLVLVVLSILFTFPPFWTLL